MSSHERPTIIALAGKPGSGKSTLGHGLAEHSRYRNRAVHISVGDEIRRVGRGDWTLPGAHEIEQHLTSPDRYDLLSDDLVYQVVVESFRRHRWRQPGLNIVFIDGYPRRLSQISDLQTIAAATQFRIGGIIHTDVDDATSIARQLRRRGRNYNEEPLSEEDAAHRIAIYNQTTPAALIALQRQEILIEHIDTSDTIGDKQKTLDRALGAVGIMLLNARTEWDYDESPA